MILKKFQPALVPFLAIGTALFVGLWIDSKLWHRSGSEDIVDAALQAVRGESLWFKADTGYTAAATGAKPPFKSGTENLPRSLQDTAVPDGLAEDASGRLIVSPGLRDIFEYFLSAVVDEPPATIHARLLAYIQSHVGSKAAQQALGILDQYGAYKLALPNLAKNYAGERPDQVSARLAAIHNLRRASLGPEVAQAFFGEEESWVGFTLNRGEILQNSHLSPQQKTARIAELQSKLSTHVQESIATTVMLQSLEDVQAEWKMRGGTPDELRAARETIVGKNGAARLEALDRANAAWEVRISAHLAQRAHILADASIAQEMKGKRIEALRRQNFSSEEQARAVALEGLQDESVSPGTAAPH